MGMAQFLEGVPIWGSVMLLVVKIPFLSVTGEMVRGQPYTITIRCLLSSEELFTMIEPIEGIVFAVIFGKFQFIEARNACARTVVLGRMRPSREQRWRRRRRRRGRRWWWWWGRAR